MDEKKCFRSGALKWRFEESDAEGRRTRPHGAHHLPAEPGIGALATQSFTDPSYGPPGLQLMRVGKSAGQALSALLAADAHEDVRQVGMVDAAGNVANHTSANAIAEFCNVSGDGYSVQANLMWKPTVCSAMVAAFEHAGGRDLAERMMTALQAAQGEGGDIRGRQSVIFHNRHGVAGFSICGSKIMQIRWRKCVGS